jgi:hypothetical protein
MREIFTYMMEKGYMPSYEDDHIVFEADDNTSVMEYEDGVLALRTFFTIDSDAYEMFLEASNGSMMKSYMAKAVVLEDKESLMFSCETFCQTFSDFCRFFPKLLLCAGDALAIHKSLIRELMSRRKPAVDEIIEAGVSRSKLLS